jgi:hypothetical protein
LNGVADVCTSYNDLRHASGPNGTFAVNHQVVDPALCEKKKPTDA